MPIILLRGMCVMRKIRDNISLSLIASLIFLYLEKFQFLCDFSIFTD